jgi:DNA topoisomerase-1
VTAQPGGVSLPAGLVYSCDSEPGIRRCRAGRGFAYRLPDGAYVRDPVEKARIKGLGIPPAYRDVWICLKANGHLQASGFDDRGRKQYRYHPDWRSFKDVKKYDALSAFGAALPRLRRIFHRGLEAAPGSFDFAAATLATLLDTVPMRIGNSVYAAENGTFGATTLTRRHVRFSGGAARFSFPGKGGQQVKCTVRRRALNRALEEVAELPGRTLFSWEDEGGHRHELESGAFNTYLAEAAGIPGISAKVFRTWAGTLEAFETAYRHHLAGEPVTIKMLAEAAARRLNNTPAIARNSYIHPAVITLAERDGADEARRRMAGLADWKIPTGLHTGEARLLHYLETAC